MAVHERRAPRQSRETGVQPGHRISEVQRVNNSWPINFEWPRLETSFFTTLAHKAGGREDDRQRGLIRGDEILDAEVLRPHACHWRLIEHRRMEWLRAASERHRTTTLEMLDDDVEREARKKPPKPIESVINAKETNPHLLSITTTTKISSWKQAVGRKSTDTSINLCTVSGLAGYIRDEGLTQGDVNEWEEDADEDVDGGGCTTFLLSSLLRTTAAWMIMIRDGPHARNLVQTAVDTQRRGGDHTAKHRNGFGRMQRCLRQNRAQNREFIGVICGHALPECVPFISRLEIMPDDEK
ncbi:hypothetical protein C8R44DRAFT_845089 [Mycena epipterygia]|nr:hypothetical protein C8R44DRAFT_845089 [Mycena epipterygia]